MRRIAVILLALTACGDNRAPAIDAGRTDAASCVVRGRNLTAERIAWGCGVEGAPVAPGCLEGSAATLVTSPPNDPRLFVLELGGRIRIIENGELRAAPFLDLSYDAGGPVNGTGLGEQGLLGLAFHPLYAQNRQLFVFYTRDNPDPTDTRNPFLNVVVRYTTSATDPYKVDPASATTVLSIQDPFVNHNGGMVEFGTDGYLYISTGDGGGVASLPPDPYNLVQNPHELLGKILRIDVDRPSGGKPYGIPTDNPFASGVAGAPEVWVIGLRNPWRFSFDRANGDLWIADVGGAVYEEVTVLRAGEQAAKNLGWPMWEGPSCHAPPCSPTGMTFPQDARHHSTGYWSIIGGQVYRGQCFPDLVGTYVYTDTGYNYLQGARLQLDGTLEIEEISGDYVRGPASLHADSRGELYETDIFGGVWHVVAIP